MLLVAGLVLGAVSYFRLPVDLFPKVDFPVIVVRTAYPGAGPEEIETAVTAVLEDEFSSLPSLRETHSTSSEGLSQIVLIFRLKSNVTESYRHVTERINGAHARLPGSVEKPVALRYDPAAAPILRFGVADTTGKRSPAALRQWVEEHLEDQLYVNGVAEVEVAGGDTRQIQVLLDAKAMEARHVPVQAVVHALQSENLNVPGGNVAHGDRNLLIRTDSSFETVDEIGDVVVRQQGTPIYLRDVAEVVDGFAERERITRLNGHASVVVSVRKQSDTNTLAAADGVKGVLAKIDAAHPGVEIVTVNDESLVVAEAMGGALSDLLWGALLAALVILLFFRSLRNTLLTVVGLPVIIISTLFLLSVFNVTLNQVSLLALALVIGLVIDDGIVVRENILRWIERGYAPREAASRGTAEVLLPVLATTATMLAVFLPVAYVEGIVGQFFRDFGFTVSLAVVVSTVEALTLAPMLAAYFFKPSKRALNGDVESVASPARKGGWLDRLYGSLLGWSLDHRWLVLLVAVVIVAGSLYAARSIERGFIPNIDRGQFDVSMELPAGTPLDATVHEALKVEAILRSHPDVLAVFSDIGSATAPESAQFSVRVRDSSGATSRAVIDDLREPLALVPNLSFQLFEGATGADLLLGSKDVIVEVTGQRDDMSLLGDYAQAVASAVADIPGAVDVEDSYDVVNPEVQLHIDHERAANVGLSTAAIGDTLHTLISGQAASTFRGGGEEADILVRLSPDDRSSLENVLDINLLTPQGQLVPLRSVVAAERAVGPTQIARADRRPVVSVGLNVSGRDVASVSSDVGDLVSTLKPPNGISVALGGDAETQAESFRSLSVALLLAVVFIYMVLASQFASFVQPLLIMLALPLALIGALLALHIVDRPLDITAYIGFIMLMGLVTKNSILLVDFANQARRDGASADLAMRRAGPVRLRPILMTAISLILAMIPVSLGLTEGGEFRQSMAIAIVGGMITSTLLTLFVVPVAYSFVVGWQDRGRGRRGEAVERYERPGRRARGPVLSPTANGYSRALRGERRSLKLRPARTVRAFQRLSPVPVFKYFEKYFERSFN